MFEELVDTLSSLASQVVCTIKRTRCCNWIEPAFGWLSLHLQLRMEIHRKRDTKKGDEKNKKERSKHNKVHWPIYFFIFSPPTTPPSRNKDPIRPVCWLQQYCIQIIFVACFRNTLLSVRALLDSDRASYRTVFAFWSLVTSVVSEKWLLNTNCRVESTENRGVLDNLIIQTYPQSSPKCRDPVNRPVVMLTTHLYLVPRPGMGGAIPSRPHITSWRVREQRHLSLHPYSWVDYWISVSFCSVSCTGAILFGKPVFLNEVAPGFLIFCRWNGGISPSNRPIRPSSTSRFVMSCHHCGLRMEICCLTI